MKLMLIMLVSVFSLFLCGCEKKPPDISSIVPSPVPIPQNEVYASGAELYALTETEESARELAEIYGIELVGFSSGVAVFHTEEDPQAVVSKGQENGWPEIGINYISHGDSN